MSALIDLRSIARALNGEVASSQVLCPGPGHGPRDRSLSVRLSPSAPDGFLAFSHAGDDWKTIRDYVRERLGLPNDSWKSQSRESRPTPKPPQQPRPQAIAKSDDNAERTGAALALWHASIDPRKTLAEKYLNSRGLELGDDVALEVLRWHSGIGAMIALFRSITTDEPQAVSRTFLDGNACKLGRKFLGPTKGAAVKLDCDAEVTMGLFIGEGIETTLSARMLGLRPAWALGSAGAIASFPVLNGVEALSLLREHDDANKRAAIACGIRWKAAGREVFDVWPSRGKDVADAVNGGAA